MTHMRFKVMNASGDSVKVFKPEEEAIARKVFEELTGPTSRMLAYVPQGGGAHRQVRTFDDLATDTEVLFSAQLRAG